MYKYTPKDFFWTLEFISKYIELFDEYGADQGSNLVSSFQNQMDSMIERIKAQSIDMDLKHREPDGYEEILQQRPAGNRMVAAGVPKGYKDRLKGALLSRMAGCTLGVPVENWSIERMRLLADKNGDSFPPVDYWTDMLEFGETERYITGKLKDFLRHYMNGVPVDDDIAYTLLGLLIVEKHGFDFTTLDVARTWGEFLPMACTAEGMILDQVRKGLEIADITDVSNPYEQWIGAAIRSDPYAYICAGAPEAAASMAYRDAALTHRRNGIYGEMFFSAAQSAAFQVSDSMSAIEHGLLEIPAECSLAKAVKWALASLADVKSYENARRLVDEKFKGMSNVHTINNACLVIFGLHLGGRDIGRVISQTVAMGLDNDCTAATAGSIAGAVYGTKYLDEHWYMPFNDRINSYLNGIPYFDINDVLERFEGLASKFYYGETVNGRIL